MIGLDTNVLVRYVTQDDPVRRRLRVHGHLRPQRDQDNGHEAAGLNHSVATASGLW